MNDHEYVSESIKKLCFCNSLKGAFQILVFFHFLELFIKVKCRKENRDNALEVLRLADISLFVFFLVF
jgi:hypothetical protein